MLNEQSAAAVLGPWPGKAGNWGRWKDDRGTLNLLTPEVVLRGIAEVRLGEVIACARAMRTHEALSGAPIFEQKMTQVRDVADDPAETPSRSAGDAFWLRVHNTENTHLDALSHIGYNGRTFNGYASDDVVTMEEGAKRLDITNALGIVTRAWFIDVAARRGLDCLEPGDCVVPDDLAEFAKRIEPGDAAIIRSGTTMTGGRRSPTSTRGVWSGVHPDCIPLLAERGIALIGGDGTEPGPSPVERFSSRPFHVMCLTVFGIHIVHGMDLERLALRCREEGRDSFLFTVSALNVPRATGSPVTPLAIL